jgi:hypothetical protein
VIPLEETLLFIEPIYLQAERSPMPELRLVVLATQDRLAYATRFPEALSQLLQGGASVAPASADAASVRPQSPSPPPQSTDILSLADRANQALADYRRLTSEGKLGEAGAKLDDLKRALEEMTRSGPQTK